MVRPISSRTADGDAEPRGATAWLAPRLRAAALVLVALVLVVLVLVFVPARIRPAFVVPTKKNGLVSPIFSRPNRLAPRIRSSQPLPESLRRMRPTPPGLRQARLFQAIEDYIGLPARAKPPCRGCTLLAALEPIRTRGLAWGAGTGSEDPDWREGYEDGFRWRYS